MGKIANSGTFAKLLMVIAILGAIGLARNTMEVALGIRANQKWYSFDADVVLTMLVFPIYLCFFGAFMLHFTAKKLGERLPYHKIFSHTFYLQPLHLLIPFLDLIGLKAKMPFLFVMPFPYIDGYFTPALTISYGIIFAWIITAFFMLFAFVKVFWVKIQKSAIILFISFISMYFPIYHMFPTFNTAFNSIFMPGAHWSKAFYGYALFFAVSSLLGAKYFLSNTKNMNNSSSSN
ncbi:MAG: hypothetical protein N3F05_04980 [Candidatus Diapherotrites archaeon]|nr:hypothetical protein [Candidatus Diapherotrites archaeon]